MTAGNINLTELRELAERMDKEWPRPEFENTINVPTDDLLALIDTAEAAIELDRKNPDYTNLSGSVELDETLNRYTTEQT